MSKLRYFLNIQNKGKSGSSYIFYVQEENANNFSSLSSAWQKVKAR
jgi:hypothetical protein